MLIKDRNIFSLDLKTDFARTLTKEEYKKARSYARLLRRAISQQIDTEKLHQKTMEALLYGQTIINPQEIMKDKIK